MGRKASLINSFLPSSKAHALCELAPFQFTLTVAGFHRAHPSTSLDKSKTSYIQLTRSLINIIICYESYRNTVKKRCQRNFLDILK
jgi:hypothetical protein